MTIFLTYLIGLGVIIAAVAYVVGFNYVRVRFFKDHITNLFDYMLMPFLAILIVMLFLALPLVIGAEFMSHF